MIRVFIIFLLSVAWAFAQDIEPVVPVTADTLLADGKKLEEQGDLQGAAKKYQAAATLRTDSMELHLRLADVWNRFLPTATREQEQADLIRAIREQFALAAKSPEADWTVYQLWAQFLVERVLSGTTKPDERLLLFEEARGLFDSAITHAKDDETRAVPRLQQALFSVSFCPEIPDTERQGKLYREALGLFEQVRKDQPNLMTPYVEDNVSVAMLHDGRLTGDHAKAHAATERMRASVENAPGNVMKRYNLACAYATLGEAEAAYGQLARCLRDDTTKAVVHAVKTDAEWKELRALPKFQTLVAGYDPAVDQIYNQGRDFQSAAERAAGVAVIIENYRQAITAYTQATGYRPDFYRAWCDLAACNQRLAGLTGDREERMKFVRAAHDAFQHAATSTGADWPIYQMWGRFLMRDAASAMPNAAEQLKVLQQAQTLLQKALDIVKFTSERGRVQLDLASCVLQIGRQVTADRERMRWMTQGVDLLQEAMKSDEIANSSTPYMLWGVAQMEIGRMQNNRLVLRQAVERLQLAAEKSGGESEVYYNLACAYSLLNQSDESIRQLRLCIERDRSGRYATLAQTDRDLDNIRNAPEFAAALNLKPTGGALTPAPAKISDY